MGITSKIGFSTRTHLLLILLGICLPLQISELIAVKIWQNQVGFPWDVPILFAIHQTSQPQLDILAIILAKIGSPKTIIPTLILIACALVSQRKWRFGIYLMITGIGSTIINLTLKELIHRPRPHLWDSTYHTVNFSFPSGHAMASMTFITLLIVLAWKTPWRLLSLVFGIFFVPTIAWTRLYLGVHYPSDILAGWLIALAWSVTVYLLIKPHRNIDLDAG
ncbi:hypothetical protein IJ00_04255 [Calothrix sp. 336/3]|nr:hypothetical protein IJ00_04255 [Calothrix sp. 336/3]